MDSALVGDIIPDTLPAASLGGFSWLCPAITPALRSSQGPLSVRNSLSFASAQVATSACIFPLLPISQCITKCGESSFSASSLVRTCNHRTTKTTPQHTTTTTCTRATLPHRPQAATVAYSVQAQRPIDKEDHPSRQPLLHSPLLNPLIICDTLTFQFLLESATNQPTVPCLLLCYDWTCYLPSFSSEPDHVAFHKFSILRLGNSILHKSVSNCADLNSQLTYRTTPRLRPGPATSSFTTSLFLS